MSNVYQRFLIFGTLDLTVVRGGIKTYKTQTYGLTVGVVTSLRTAVKVGVFEQNSVRFRHSKVVPVLN